MKHYTEKQLRAKGQLGNIFATWQHSKDAKIASQLLEEIHEDERHMILEELLWIALGAREWDLASFCVSQGVSIKSEADDLMDWGSIRKSMDIYDDRADIVEWLLQNGAEIDRRGWLDRTPLMFAAKKGFVETVKMLVAKGADVNAYSSVDGGCTPLMAARYSGHSEIIRLLIMSGAEE